MPYFPGNGGDGFGLSPGQDKEHGKPFGADVHALHAEDHGGVIRYFIRQHPQSASNGHFSCPVEEIHIPVSCCIVKNVTDYVFGYIIIPQCQNNFFGCMSEYGGNHVRGLLS